MWLTKLKIVASLLLAAMVVAGGTGLLTYGVLGTGQPGAQAKEQPLPKPAQGFPPPATPPRREADPDLLQAEKDRLQVEKERLEAEKQERERERAQVKDQVNRLEAVLQKQEEQWSDELIEARKQLLIAEEQLRQLERRQAVQRESEQKWGELGAAERRVKSLQDSLEQLTVDLKGDLKGVAVQVVERDRQRVGALLDQAREKLRGLEQYSEIVEQQRTKELIEARQKVVIAEERLRRLERRQATQRERTQAQLQAADERLRQLQGAPSQPAPAQGRIQELERKVDQLLREMTDLRREMRRKPPEEK